MYQEAKMKKAVGSGFLTLGSAGVALCGALATSAWAIDPSRIEFADKNPNDWLTYHGTYKSYHYSPLDQINADNVEQLKVAWMHQPGRSTRGLQSMPLVADGALYYSGSYSRLFALDGATGRGEVDLLPEARRGSRRGADPLPLQPRHRARARQGLRRHRRRPADRASTWRPASRPGTPSWSIPRS